MREKILLIFLSFLPATILLAQTCTNTGQTPSSAILLCGAESYVQGAVPVCGQTNIPVPCPATAIYQNNNPIWFKMNCFGAGTLGFIITPNDANDNYDWQLFDISGRNNDDVFSDPSLFLACNWCTDPGETGASMDGNNLIVCSGVTGESFSKMPDIKQGHEYLLMVSDRNAGESGFQIAISGGSGSVTDPVEPQLFSSRLSCNSKEINVYLNKKVYCASIAGDGSDFIFSGPATITSADVVDCSANEGGLVILKLSNAVPPGSYTLSVQTGTDGNTMQDRCGRYIAEGNNIPVALTSLQPMTMDSLTKPECSPSVLRLVFQNPIQCSSIAANGSDFIITGQQPVGIDNITISCSTRNATTSVIELHLTAPITVGGNYQLSLVSGSDGNTLIDECGGAVLPGTLTFLAKASVVAPFSYTIKASCKEDTIYFTHTNTAGVTDWIWSFDNTAASNSPTQVKIYPAIGKHVIQLIVSNGACKDTAEETILLDNKVVAAIDGPDIICPEDTVRFNNTSTGTVNIWNWSFGNGNNSNQHTPAAQRYPVTNRELSYIIKLIATNTAMNCKDSALHRLTVLSSCFIAVPTAFTPNGDGLNDYLQPANALKADNLIFKVYNRFGQLVFTTKDWTKKWDGRINGVLQNTGVYAWMLSFTHHDTGEKVFMKGTTVLIR